MTEAWTAPQVERPYPGLILGERQALEAWLDFHRHTLLHKCGGLTAAQLKQRAVPPSRLDDAVPGHGDHPERARDIRSIYLHMIEEYARHTGHDDLIRERIDGVTGA